MEIPTGSSEEILAFAQGLAKECMASQKQRTEQYATWRSYMFAGTEDGTRPSIYNKCGPHIERLAALLFSPAEVRFLVEFDRRVEARWKDRALDVSRVLSEEFHGTGTDLVASDAVTWGLAYGAAFVKLTWNEKRGMDPYLVLPNHLGVRKENVPGLDRQEAICHVSYITRDELRRRVAGRPDAASIMEKATRQNVDQQDEEVDSLIHQIVIGGLQPVQTTPTGIGGQVNIFNTAPAAQMSPEVLAGIVKFYELWVVDDKRGDWTTLQFLDPDVLIEGGKQHRNIFIPGRQPFQMIQPNPMPDYFWGRSVLSDLWRLQDVITQRIEDISHITRLRAHPPRALIGFSGISDESKAAMGSLDGLMIEGAPNAKIESLAPEMPQDAYTQLNEVTKYFDETGGFMPIMQGQNESGVRSGNQASSLMRSAGARMRNGALLVERQVGELGDLYLEVLEAKEPGAIVYESPGEGGKPEEWLLSQMPDDRRVTIDSHSSSPAFSEDQKQLAFALASRKAITSEGLLDLTHPPMLDHLKRQLKAEKEAEQKFLAEHPEAMKGGKGHK